MEQAHGGVNVSASQSQSGQEAADLADANRQLTMVMPGVDRLEVGRRKAAVAALASTQVLMLRTGVPLDAETAERIGVETSVAKPVVRADLHEILVGLVSSGPTTSTVRRGAAEPVVPAASASASKAPSRPHGRGCVLVVEDNPTKWSPWVC